MMVSCVTSLSFIRAQYDLKKSHRLRDHRIVCVERGLKDYLFPALCCKVQSGQHRGPRGQFGDHEGTEICTSAHRLHLRSVDALRYGGHLYVFGLS